MGIILDVIIMGILILSTWLGYKKGLTKSLLKIFTFLIAIIISFILFRPIANIVIKQTNIVNNLQSTISTAFKNEQEKNKELKDENLQDDDTQNKDNRLFNEKRNNNSEQSITSIFYKYIENKIIESTNEAKDFVIEKASRKIAISIVNIGVYIILFITIRIILIFIKALADLIKKIPVIKQCDEIGGGIYGLLRASIIILVIFTIISIITSLIPLSGIIEAIDQSIIAKFIYENNIIIQIIL